MFPVINEILDKGNGVRLAVTGGSMRPFLREGLDSVELFSCDFDSLLIGDIVVIQRSTGEYVMHRVLKKLENSFYIIGDAQCWVEGPLCENQVTAVVKTVWRKNKRINCAGIWWRFLSLAWLRMLPVRGKLFKAFRIIKRILK